MKLLRKILGRTGSGAPAVSSDLFDVHHQRTLEALGLSDIAPATGADPGAAVREFFLHNPEAQWRYPLGLLPMGQKRFVKWLLRKGRAQHDFSDAQILAFLHATAADLPRYIALTFRINPKWQQQFLEQSENGAEVIRWLRTEFPKFKPLRQLTRLPVEDKFAADSPLAGVNFLGHFCYPSGLEQAALGYIESLAAAGLKVACRDVPTGVRTELTPREDWLGFEKFPMTITNVAPAPHFGARYERAGLAPRPGVLQIAYWAWELETIPDEWIELASTIDEVWTPTPFVAAAMRTKMPMPVVEMLPGVSIGAIEEVPRERFGLTNDEFVFLFMFDMRSDFERKNPLAVIRAFRAAFSADDRATLVIKLSRGSSDVGNLERLRSAAEGAKVVVVDELVSRAQAYGYIALADAVVSLHRSEGFGLLMAEAMLLGKPVMATNYSGNTAFMNRENSLLIDYRMVEVASDGPIYKRGNRWAEPSVEEAAAGIRRLFEDREAARTLGRRAQQDTSRLLAPKAAGERMKARLAQLVAERGL